MTSMRGNQQQQSTLARLERLEYHVISNNSSPNQESLSGRVSQLSKQLEELLMPFPELLRIQKARGEHSAILDNSSISLNQGVQEEMLLASQPFIDKTTKLLKVVDSLQGELNKSIPALDKEDELMQEEAHYRQLTVAAQELHNEVELTLMHYANMIKLMSEKFILWNSLLQDLENKKNVATN